MQTIYFNLCVDTDKKTISFPQPASELTMASAMRFSQAYQRLSTFEYIEENVDNMPDITIWDAACKTRETMGDNPGMTEDEALEIASPTVYKRMKNLA